MKMDDKLNTLFNIESSKLDIPVFKEEEKDKSDFDIARSTLRNMIDKNDDVISDLVSIAKSSEHPRAFEVIAELVKAQTGLAKELMAVNKVKKEIDKDDSSPSKIDTQNNIVFAGSTSDLLKMISAERAKVIESK